jgi:hypothetical protein
MAKDPSLPNAEHSVSHLEYLLLKKGLEIAKDFDVSNSDCMKMENVVNEAIVQCQNIMLKALTILNNKQLLSLCPEIQTNN